MYNKTIIERIGILDDFVDKSSKMEHIDLSIMLLKLEKEIINLKNDIKFELDMYNDSIIYKKDEYKLDTYNMKIIELDMAENKYKIISKTMEDFYKKEN